jgi:hypothetical protein
MSFYVLCLFLATSVLAVDTNFKSQKRSIRCCKDSKILFFSALPPNNLTNGAQKYCVVIYFYYLLAGEGGDAG